MCTSYEIPIGYQYKKFKTAVTCLDTFCAGHNEWRLSLCVVDLTKAQSANTVHQLDANKPSRIRYTTAWRCMLPGTVRRSVQCFVDLARTLCSVVESNVDTLQKVTHRTSSITVNTLHLATCIWTARFEKKTCSSINTIMSKNLISPKFSETCKS